MMYYHWGYGPAFGGLGIIFAFLWWFIVASIIVALFRFIFGHGHYPHSPDDYSDQSDSALNILRQRYAKGEITKKEFDAMKKDIS
jgi:putative membrane protein